MVKDRIKAFLKSQNITVTSFEESIGVSNGYVNAISKSIGIDKINTMLEKYSNLNIEWVLTGKGTMLKNDAPPPDATVQPIHQPRSPEKKMETQSINLYDFKATAGLRELLDNRHANIIDTIKIPNLPKCDGAIHIIGDSMYPRLRPGDIIFYKELPIDLQSILYGEMYLLSYCIDGDDYCVVKYIKRSDKGEPFITLASHNPAHEDTDIDFRCVNAIALIKGSYNQTTMS
jgi:phage repressor protein C with HTH and peptisase S24 domain